MELIPLLLIPTLLVLAANVSCVVVHQMRLVAGPNGRADYVLSGESFELSCHYIMKDGLEDLKQVVWSKDGINILRWRKSRPGLEVLSHTFKGHVEGQSQSSHIMIKNATIDMHGKYKCSIKSDLNTQDLEHNLIVIAQTSCKLNDWRVTSEPNSCRESFKLDCRNMFPRPVPSCGLWSGRLDRFLRSISVDISEELNKKTFHISYMDKFQLLRADNATSSKLSKTGSDRVNSTSAVPLVKLSSATNTIDDLFQHAGSLVFKCDIQVPETSWKLSLHHRMFDFQDGCNENPLETIERLRKTFSDQSSARLVEANQRARSMGLEMLTGAKLHFNLFPPPANRKQFDEQVALNCWQRPRLGTLAKLSCGSTGNGVSASRLSISPERSPQKLIGASLLECRSAGWVLLPESTLSKKAEKIPKMVSFSRNGRRAESFTQNDTSVSSNSIGTDPNESRSQPADSYEIYQPVRTNDLDNSNNNDNNGDDTDDSNPLAQGEPNELPQDTADAFSLSELERALLGGAELVSGQAKMSQAQIAAILPTCVSTSHRIVAINNQNNRLELPGLGPQETRPIPPFGFQPEEVGAALESASPSHNHLRPVKNHIATRKQPIRAGSSSTSSSAAAANGDTFMIRSSLLLLVILNVSMQLRLTHIPRIER